MARIEDYITQQLPESVKVDDRQKIGIGGFTLDVRVRESIKDESTAPLTVLEDGSFAHDHIILSPTVLQIDGEVSDIKVDPNPAIKALKRGSATVGVISKYLPTHTQSQLNRIQTLAVQTRDTIQKVDSVINDFGQVFDFFGNKSGSATPQQLFFDTMQAIRKSKQLIQIEMPFKVYQNMAIIGITINTDNVGAPLGYSITAQEIRFAQVKLVGVERYKANPSAGLGGQTDTNQNKGRNGGTKVEESLASQIMGLF